MQRPIFINGALSVLILVVIGAAGYVGLRERPPQQQLLETEGEAVASEQGRASSTADRQPPLGSATGMRPVAPAGLRLPTGCAVTAQTEPQRWSVDCGVKNSNARGALGPALEEQGWQFCDAASARGWWYKDPLLTTVTEGPGTPAPFTVSQTRASACPGGGPVDYRDAVVSPSGVASSKVMTKEQILNSAVKLSPYHDLIFLTDGSHSPEVVEKEYGLAPKSDYDDNYIEMSSKLIAFGDLNGNGEPDAAAVIHVQQVGSNGVFKNIVVFTNSDAGPVQAGIGAIGTSDNLRVDSVEIKGGKIIVTTMEYDVVPYGLPVPRTYFINSAGELEEQQ